LILIPFSLAIFKGKRKKAFSWLPLKLLMNMQRLIEFLKDWIREEVSKVNESSEEKHE
jgi:hypothetical protein